MIVLAENSYANPIGVYALLAFCILVPVAYLVFWIWMLVDCIRNEQPGSYEKKLWTVFILLFGGFAAFVYNISRRKQRIRELGR